MNAIILNSVLTLIFIINSTVKGFPEGAPTSTCLTMYPKHENKESQTSPSPFTIRLSQTQYNPGQNINIILSANDQRSFTGLQIRAHREKGDTEEILGTFTSFPQSKTQAYNCFGGKKNLVTHKNKHDVKSVNLTWKAPNTNVGNIVFVATFVESFKVFWINVTATLKSQTFINQSPVQKVSIAESYLNFTECGKTVGCFLYPFYCSGTDCDSGMTYTSDKDNVTIQIFAKAQGYASVGFSHDREMGEDQTITCTLNGDHAAMQYGYNDASYDNERQPMANRLSNMEVKNVDGKIICSFTRPKAMTVYDTNAQNGYSTFDLNDNFYVMVAWSYLYRDSDVMAQHIELPITTYRKVNFKEYIIHRGQALQTLTQVHGTLMITAWILCGGLTTIISRYYKTAMSKMLLGSQLWFQVHRTAALTTFLITAMAFVIIFVKVDGFTEAAETHAYIGIIVVTATILQIIGGFLRPNPKHKHRSIFNWVHWCLGKLTQLLSAVAIYLAFNAPLIPRAQKVYGTILFGVWFGLQCLWEIFFELRKFRKSGRMSKVNKEAKQIQVNSEGPTIGDKVFLFLYILTMLGIFAFAISSIFLF